MAEPRFFFHPVIGLIVVTLILVAFVTKVGQYKHRMLHYWAGIGAVTLALAGIVVAAWAFGPPSGGVSPRLGGGMRLPREFYLHATVGLITAGLLLAQLVLGGLMYYNGRMMRDLLPLHRWIGRALGIDVVVLIALGGFHSRNLFQSNDVRTAILVLTGISTIAATALVVSRFRKAARQHRPHHERRIVGQPVKLQGNPHEVVNIFYQPDNVEVHTHKGRTILLTSLESGIPHTHVCGGNARCSTCRVAVLDGLECCLPRNASEIALAERLAFPPQVRLACQTQITGDVKVRRLVLDDSDIQITSQINSGAKPGSIGEEKHLAILFADIRGFTSFAESLPPYDVIHALNRYYKQMDEVIERHGGHIDNYIGDGLLAVFEADSAEATALNAVKTGLGMLKALEALRPYFHQTYAKALEIGVGVHYGQVVLGDLGTPRSRRTTVIGDTVNFASRIESANKDAETHLLISEETYDLVKEGVETGKTVRIPVKGKTGEYTLYEIVGMREAARAGAVLDRATA